MTRSLPGNDVYSREEVAQHVARWRRAVDQRDLDGMASMFTEDARGGNSQYGVFDGRKAIMRFIEDHWPEAVPNRSVWHAIDGARVVDKWRETLPGQAPPGYDYGYDGITELSYAGSRKWRFIYGIPDVVGLMRVVGRWRRDGQADAYGEVYPDIPR